MRIAFIHNPSAPAEPSATADAGAARVPASMLIAAALRTLSNTAAKNLVGKLLRHLSSSSSSDGSTWRATLDARELSTSEALQVHGVDVQLLLSEALHERTRQLIRAHARFCTHALRLAPAQRTVVSNGRVFFSNLHLHTHTHTHTHTLPRVYTLLCFSIL